MITLKNNASDGSPLEAVFLPEKGMNLVSYKKGDIEVIAQQTKDLFDERYSGLGPLIGPHFHRRHKESLPTIANEDLFPHIARIKEKGILDPFSHGIARYAPWQYELGEHSFRGVLTGKDLWNGVSLAELEGQNFKMRMDVSLLSKGLKIDLSIVSDTNSLVGMHYFYHLSDDNSTITSSVNDFYIHNEEKKEIPAEWLNDKRQLHFSLKQEADYTFYPYPDPLQAEIVLDTSRFRLKTAYSCNSQENAWQLYRPAEASFVCIEPISAQFPRHPILTVSSLSVLLSIESLNEISSYNHKSQIH